MSTKSAKFFGCLKQTTSQYIVLVMQIDTFVFDKVHKFSKNFQPKQ